MAWRPAAAGRWALPLDLRWRRGRHGCCRRRRRSRARPRRSVRPSRSGRVGPAAQAHRRHGCPTWLPDMAARHGCPTWLPDMAAGDRGGPDLEVRRGNAPLGPFPSPRQLQKAGHEAGRQWARTSGAALAHLAKRQAEPGLRPFGAENGPLDRFQAPRLCCTNRVRDSSRESSVVAGMHEQTHALDLQDQELASLQ